MTHLEALLCAAFGIPVVYKDLQNTEIGMGRIDYVKEFFSDGKFYRDAVMSTGRSTAQAKIEDVRAADPEQLSEILSDYRKSNLNKEN